MSVNVKKDVDMDGNPINSVSTPAEIDIRHQMGHGVEEIDFFKQEINATIGQREFPSFFYTGGKFHAYYLTGGNYDIRHATSPDGINWTDDTANNPVLSASQTWENGNLWICEVWEESGSWYMLYGGQRATNDWPIGLATSSDGVNWTKEGTNPVLETGSDTWDESKLDNSAIIKVGSTYYLWYNNYNEFYNGLTHRQTGLATSTDLISWTKDTDNPLFTGYQFCPHVFKQGDAYYMIIVQNRSGLENSLEVYRATNADFSDKQWLGYIIPDNDVSSMPYPDFPKIITTDIERTSLAGDVLFLYFSESGPGARLVTSPNIIDLLNQQTQAQKRAIFTASLDISNQSSTSGTLIEFDTVEKDPLGGWDGTDDYIVYDPGEYQVYVMLTIPPNNLTTDDRIAVQIEKISPASTNASKAYYRSISIGSKYQSVAVRGRFNCMYGDNLSAKIYHDHGSAIDVWASSGSTYMEIEQIKKY